MYQRDYILKLMEQTAQVVMKVLNKRGQSFHDRLELLNQALKHLVGLDSKLLQALSVKDLLALLSPGGYPDIGKVLAASDLLQARVKVLQEEGQTEAARAEAHKSLELLLTVRTMDDNADLRRELDARIEAALEPVGQSAVGAGVWELLAAYYEENGRLSKAEDALFHWLDQVKEDGRPEEVSRVAEIGARMYERWLLLPDTGLDNGALPREEVRQGMAELEKLRAKGRL